jgi:hypothetical protein
MLRIRKLRATTRADNRDWLLTDPVCERGEGHALAAVPLREDLRRHHPTAKETTSR